MTLDYIAVAAKNFETTEQEIAIEMPNRRYQLENLSFTKYLADCRYYRALRDWTLRESAGD